MSLEGPQAYRLGKRSAERLVRALKAVLGEDDPLAELGPYLQGPENCGMLRDQLSGYFAWKSLAWAYDPEGPPPSEKEALVVEVLCRSGIPVDEELLEKLARGLEDEGGGGEEW